MGNTPSTSAAGNQYSREGNNNYNSNNNNRNNSNNNSSSNINSSTNSIDNINAESDNEHQNLADIANASNENNDNVAQSTSESVQIPPQQYFVVGSGGNDMGIRGNTRSARRSNSYMPAAVSSLLSLRSSSEEHRERTRREDRQLREQVDDDERTRREGSTVINNNSTSTPISTSTSSSNIDSPAADLTPMDVDESNLSPAIPMDLDGGSTSELIAQTRSRIELEHRSPHGRLRRFRPRSQSLGNLPGESSPSAAEGLGLASEPQQRARELFGSLTQSTTSEGIGSETSNSRPRHRFMERVLAAALGAAWSSLSSGPTGRGFLARSQSGNRSDEHGQSQHTEARRSRTVEESLDEIISIIQNGLLPRANSDNGSTESEVNSQQQGQNGIPPRFQPTADGRGFVINAGDGSTMRMFRLPSSNTPTPSNGPDGRPRMMVPVVFIAIRTVSPTRDAQSSQSTPVNENVPSAEENRNEEQSNTVTADNQPSSEETPQDGRNRRTISWIVYIVGGNVPPGHPMASLGLPPNSPNANAGDANVNAHNNRTNIPTTANALQALFSDNPSYEDLLLLSMLMGPVRPPTTTQSEIDAVVPVQLWNNEMKTNLLGDTDKCRVCLSEYENGEEVRVLGCRHGFHRECIDKWLTEGSNKCPLCRSTPVGGGGQGQESPIVAPE